MKKDVVNYAYKNQDLPIDERIKILLEQMTLDEKVAQTFSLVTFEIELDEEGKINTQVIKKCVPHGVGAFLKASKKYLPYDNARYVNALQEYLINQTRLGIPAIIHEESLHGFLGQGATNFPQAIALASTWEPELVKEVFKAVAKESRVRGANQVFAPVLDLGRDPRWGRIEETYGEDVYLTTQMAVATVRGYQGENNELGENHVAATLKHFAGYGQSAGGRNFAPSEVTERIMREEILKPFKAAVEVGVMGIMPSHNEINGIPCHANRELLTDILRDEWGFEGIVVSDASDIQRMGTLHHVVANDKEAAVMALKAGVDMEIPKGIAYSTLVESVTENCELEEILNKTVERILRLKFRLGLFQNNFVDPERAQKINHCKAHKDLAQKAAQKSIILLKNKDDILPLDTNKYKKIALIGPNAAIIQLGAYSPKPYKGVSILEGLKARLDGRAEIRYSQGCSITKNDDDAETEMEMKGVTIPELFTPEEEASSICEAVNTAKECDIAIVCVGDNSLTTREAVFMKNHVGDRDNLDLVGQQNELVRAIMDTGIPTVVVLVNGKPLTINEIDANADAILEAWYAGEQTGNAVADILLGNINPSGKLTVTFPRSVGQIPVYYSQKPGGMFKGYLFVDSTPLYPFGFGLSYTKFEYEDLKVVPDRIKKGENTAVSINISNIGKCEGDEVVQLYIRDKVSSVTRPVMELKGFQKISLCSGETKKIVFDINPEMLSFLDREYNKVIEPGEFDIMVGTSSVEHMNAVLTVI